MTIVLKFATAALGALFLALGLVAMFAPGNLVVPFGVEPVGRVGLSTLRGDLGGMFLALAAMAGFGLWRRDSAVLWVASTLVGLVAVGRVVGWVIDGVQADTVAPVIVELVAALTWGLTGVSQAAAKDGGLQHARAERVVAASLDHVWAIASDVTSVVRWHPAVASADLLSPSPTGLGAVRRCHFHDGSNVREEVVVAQAGRRVRLRISEFSAPLKRLEAEIAMAPGEDGHTLASFTLFYEVKGGVLGQVLGATMLRREMGKVAARALAGLAHHAATDELVGKDFVAQVA